MAEARPLPSTAAAVPVIDAATLLDGERRPVVDLRSPAEFAEDHVPGARNVPLFDDAERALVGLLYHRASPEAAFARGRRVVLDKIEALVRAIAEHVGADVGAVDLAAHARELTRGGLAALEDALGTRPGSAAGGEPILYCWRGGLRSRSVVALLRGIGVGAAGLEGGYKAYRRHVRRSLEDWTPPPTVVLRGLTGVGKTLVLRELERIRPGWTLDLERLAGHRSSLLGMVGLEPCSQKAFESRIAERLRRGFPGPLVLEGESRRVGDAIVPGRVWDALRGGVDLSLVAGRERRVDVLIEDYLAHDSNRAQLRVQLAEVERRMRPPAPLVELLDRGRERELVELLLERYYDPLYRHGEKGKRYAATIDASEPGRAAGEIARWIEQNVGVGGSAAGRNARSCLPKSTGLSGN